MKRILVDIQIKALDDEGQPQMEKVGDQEVQVFDTIHCYLHHWGTQFETWVDENGNSVVGQYTVAICEDIETGIMHTFQPTQLRVLNSVTY